MKVSDEPIVIEQVFNTSIDRLWKALSDLEEMKLWFFDNIESFEPEVGFETQFLVQVEERKFTHLWRITEVVPFQKITYNWKYEEYHGDSFVTFELFEMSDNVKLKLSVDVVEDFQSDIPEFSRESCIGGWNYFLGKNLKEYLEDKNIKWNSLKTV